MAKPRFSCSKTEMMVELLHCNPATPRAWFLETGFRRYDGGCAKVSLRGNSPWPLGAPCEDEKTIRLKEATRHGVRAVGSRLRGNDEEGRLLKGP